MGVGAGQVQSADCSDDVASSEWLAESTEEEGAD